MAADAYLATSLMRVIRSFLSHRASDAGQHVNPPTAKGDQQSGTPWGEREGRGGGGDSRSEARRVLRFLELTPAVELE